MPADISFADRLGSIVSLTDAIYNGMGKTANTQTAQNRARELEEGIRKTSSSPEDYRVKIQAIIVLSEQARHLPPREEEEPAAELERLNREGPSFGQYRHATFHADGLMSTVYKAVSTDTNARPTIVAVKVTHPASMTPPHDSEREARILVKARHEHVVPLLDTLHESGGQFILVFPFLRQDLENLLRSGRLDHQQASMVFDGLFKALDHIHALGMIHRDVKPSNILLKSMSGPVYLADFGIAWSPDDEDSEPADSKITDVGTTCYRPIELLFGDQSYDASLDMWAAGCVVAEMVTSWHRPLFDAGPLGSELSLIKSMFETLGTPTDETWPSARKLPDWGKMKFQTFPARPWNDILTPTWLRHPDKAFDFVSKTVRYEASERLTAKEALEHPLRVGIGNSNSVRSSRMPWKGPNRSQWERERNGNINVAP